MTLLPVLMMLALCACPPVVLWLLGDDDLYGPRERPT